VLTKGDGPDMKWYDASEYDRPQQMTFPDLRGGPQRRIGTEVSYDTAQARWVSTPIKVYVGPSHC
jgi:hypothetical protein